MSEEEQQQAPGVSPRLPPTRQATEPASPAAAMERRQAREQRDATARGVLSIPAMREAIKRVARDLPVLTEVPRVGLLNAGAFRARAMQGLPFVMTGLVGRWPLCALTPQDLRERFGHVPVRARVGDYINTAFATDRAMADMSMQEYLDLAALPHELPPYVGNLELRELNSMCHWPSYFGKMGPPRFWLGPAGTITPLHSDYDDNIFAQIWGSKRVILSPPHHDEFLYTWEANAMLYGSPVNPAAPDYEKYPLARQATMTECIVNPGDLLYLPAGWYHQVSSLTPALSSNRWARGLPFALTAEKTGVSSVNRTSELVL